MIANMVVNMNPKATDVNKALSQNPSNLCDEVRSSVTVLLRSRQDGRHNRDKNSSVFTLAESVQCLTELCTYLGKTFVFASSILTHFLSFCIRFCNFIAFGCEKSKSAVNWVFIFWKTGSCTVACARRARLSDAAEENAPLTELVEILSVDIQNGVSV